MSQQTSGKPTKSAGWLVNLMAFIAVICVGVSLILSKLGFLDQISEALSTIANVISYLVLVIVSCFYIVKRKNIWLWVTWAVSVALIVISFIL